MKKLSYPALLYLYIKSNLKLIVFVAVCSFIFELVFVLYGLPADAVGYAGLLVLVTAILFIIHGYIRFLRRYRKLETMKEQVTITLAGLPQPLSLIEDEYQEVMKVLFNHKTELVSSHDRKYMDMIDYYTLWAHQIKTPIAAMRLLLDTGATDTMEIKQELFKIERYVEMVLQYLRLENLNADLSLDSYDLSKIVRQAAKKYATVFIHKKIRLDLKEFDYQVLTDEKWLSFVVEQILSNALKYTSEGSITIEAAPGPVLSITDTGIGIYKEDLPRIFEKGFTGYNGRMDKKATGLGLYLTKSILNKLGHNISINSKPGSGTTVLLDLSRPDPY